ncbi:hypothetical protein ACJX0J_001020, partial (mitochondrion) [Zea mays]
MGVGTELGVKEEAHPCLYSLYFFLLFAYFTGTGLKRSEKATSQECGFLKSNPSSSFLKIFRTLGIGKLSGGNATFSTREVAISSQCDRITNLFPCVFQLTSLKESYSFDEEEVVFEAGFIKEVVATTPLFIRLYQSPIPDTKEAVHLFLNQPLTIPVPILIKLTSKTKRNKWARRSEALAYEDSCF